MSRTKKSKSRPPSIRDEYPDHPREHGHKPVAARSGNKVRWETYATRAEAEAVAKWAETEAEIKFRQGYDAGYCAPGSITKVIGGYEVCIL